MSYPTGMSWVSSALETRGASLQLHAGAELPENQKDGGLTDLKTRRQVNASNDVTSVYADRDR